MRYGVNLGGLRKAWRDYGPAVVCTVYEVKANLNGRKTNLPISTSSRALDGGCLSSWAPSSFRAVRGSGLCVMCVILGIDARDSPSRRLPIVSRDEFVSMEVSSARQAKDC